MAKVAKTNPGIIRRILSSRIAWWIDTVPDELSRCEFDCRKTTCLHGERDSCQLRIDYMKRLQADRASRQGDERPPDLI